MVCEHPLVKLEDAVAARDSILDAAEKVMRELGIARATTKEIARAAGYSEALLYKHFADKQAIYLAVLKERLGAMSTLVEPGTGDLHVNLVESVVGLMGFYVRSIPMSASIFSDSALLTAWREGMTARGAGPRSPVRGLERYLDAELALGRLPAGSDAGALAALLCGAAFQAAFLACFDGLAAVPDADRLADRWVAALVPTTS